MITNIRHISNHMEIYFWSTLITLMSESEFLQRCIRNAYNFKLTGKQTRFLLEALAWSIVGLLLGFAAGLLSA